MQRSNIRFFTLVVGTALLVANAGVTRGTALTYDIAFLTANSFVPDDYGDNVASFTNGNFTYGSAGGFTPNITTVYAGKGSQSALNFWTTGYSDLTNVIEYEPDGDPGYLVKLLADPGFNASLTHFDMGNFGPEVTLPSIRVLDHAGTVLFSSANLTVPANTQPHLSFDFPAGLTDSALTIDVDTTGLGGNSDNIGLDNITFSQTAVAPEPTALGLLGLLSLVRLRRARRL